MTGELATLKAQAEAAAQAHRDQIKHTAQESTRQAERLAQVEAERDKSNRDAGSSREDAAKLRGQVEAMQAQAADLMLLLSKKE